MEKQCAVCRELFIDLSSVIGGRPRIYCAVGCRRMAERKRRRQKSVERRAERFAELPAELVAELERNHRELVAMALTTGEFCQRVGPVLTGQELFEQVVGGQKQGSKQETQR